MRDLRKLSGTYIRAFQLVGALAFLWAVPNSFSASPLWLVLIPLTILAAWLPIKIPIPKRAGNSWTITLGDLFVFLGLIYFSPSVAVILAGVEGVSSSLRVRVASLHKIAFNGAQPALVATIVGALFSCFLGSPHSPIDLKGMDLVRVLVLTGTCAMLYFLLNSFIVSGAVSLSSGKRVNWLSNFAFAFPSNLLNSICVLLIPVLLRGDSIVPVVTCGLFMVSYYGLSLWLTHCAEAHRRREQIESGRPV